MALDIDCGAQRGDANGRAPLTRRAELTLGNIEYAMSTILANLEADDPDLAAIVTGSGCDGEPPMNLFVLENRCLAVIGDAGAPDGASTLPSIPGAHSSTRSS